MTQAPQTATIECYKCNNCGNTTLARKKICPKCGSDDIGVIQSEGKGKVVDFITIYFPPHNYKDIAPYNSLKVQLDNGCMAFGVIEGDGKDIPLGSRVTMIKHDETTGGLFFRLD